MERGGGDSAGTTARIPMQLGDRWPVGEEREKKMKETGWDQRMDLLENLGPDSMKPMVFLEDKAA
jgi:hypothetical protein